MYSFAPLATINTIGNHDGFTFIAIIAAIIFVFVWINDLAGYRELNMYKVFVLFCVPVGFAAYVSWNTGEYREFANTPVTGTFVKFEAEGYKERSGKTYVDRHYTYVVYNVEGNNVLLRSEVGLTYPKQAVLYKN